MQTFSAGMKVASFPKMDDRARGTVPNLARVRNGLCEFLAVMLGDAGGESHCQRSFDQISSDLLRLADSNNASDGELQQASSSALRQIW